MAAYLIIIKYVLLFYEVYHLNIKKYYLKYNVVNQY
jgi:hypothetical protein